MSPALYKRPRPLHLPHAQSGAEPTMKRENVLKSTQWANLGQNALISSLAT